AASAPPRPPVTTRVPRSAGRPHLQVQNGGLPMIDLVLPEARFRFAGALMEMHRDRKSVFVDRLGWALPARGSWLEVDQFDDDYAVYLLAREQERHQGSVRLLPSTRPTMLDTLFSELCPDGVPSGEDVWEISRLV